MFKSMYSIGWYPEVAANAVPTGITLSTEEFQSGLGERSGWVTLRGSHTETARRRRDRYKGWNMFKRTRDPRWAHLLITMSTEVHTGIRLLAESLSTTSAERSRYEEQFLSLEGRVLDIHSQLMTQIRATFLTPLPRETMYWISQHLNRCMEHVTAAADMMLHRQGVPHPATAAELLETLTRQAEATHRAMASLESTEAIDEYWLQMQRLTKQANRIYRSWFNSADASFQPATALRISELGGHLLGAVQAQRDIPLTCGAFMVRES